MYQYGYVHKYARVRKKLREGGGGQEERVGGLNLERREGGRERGREREIESGGRVEGIARESERKRECKGHALHAYFGKGERDRGRESARERARETAKESSTQPCMHTSTYE